MLPKQQSDSAPEVIIVQQTHAHQEATDQGRVIYFLVRLLLFCENTTNM
jgi:hypothetical protein